MENNKTYVALTHADEVLTICKPMFEFTGLNYFGYFRVYNNSEIIGLLTDPYWFEHFHIQHKFHYQSGKKLAEGAHFWINTHDPIISQHAREYFNHDHGMFLISEKEDYIESAIFATEVGNHGILDVYINNLDVLQQFVYYFQDQADELINLSKKTPLYLPNRCKFTETKGEETSKIITKTRPLFHQNNKHIIYTPSGKVVLTNREQQCLKALCKGMSSKLAAKHLNISYRTVEVHVAQLREKFGCGSSQQLICTMADLSAFNLLGDIE